MKNLVYQVNIIQNEDTYADCIKSVADYCQKYQIEHRIQTEPILKIKPKTDHRNRKFFETGDSSFRFHTLKTEHLLIYEKENAFDLLDQYDNICILDRDVLIRDFAPNIFDEIEDYEFAGVIETQIPLGSNEMQNQKISSSSFNRARKKLSISQYYPLREEADFKWTKNGASYYNCGVMLLSSSIKKYLNAESAREFLLRPEFERFIEGENEWYMQVEQTLINYWLKKQKVKTKDLSWKWNALYGLMSEEDINNSYFVHFFMDMFNLPTKNIRDAHLK
jgi:hypothetical protein